MHQDALRGTYPVMPGISINIDAALQTTVLDVQQQILNQTRKNVYDHIEKVGHITLRQLDLDIAKCHREAEAKILQEVKARSLEKIVQPRCFHFTTAEIYPTILQLAKDIPDFKAQMERNEAIFKRTMRVMLSLGDYS